MVAPWGSVGFRSGIGFGLPWRCRLDLFHAGLGMAVGIDQALFQVAGGLLHHAALFRLLRIGRFVTLMRQAAHAIILDLFIGIDLAVCMFGNHMASCRVGGARTKNIAPLPASLQVQSAGDGALTHTWRLLLCYSCPAIPITLHARLTERLLRACRHRTILFIYTVF